MGQPFYLIPSRLRANVVEKDYVLGLAGIFEHHAMGGLLVFLDTAFAIKSHQFIELLFHA